MVVYLIGHTIHQGENRIEMLTEQDVRNIFIETDALRRGHFLLSSGKHSSEYWEKFWVLQYPHHVERLCSEIASRFADEKVDVVLGPTTGGILLAFETARQLGVRALYAEKEGGKRLLRRGLKLEPGTRVLIVDDIMTTGGATKECLVLAAEHQTDVVGVAVLVDRSGGTIELGTRLEALLTVEAESFAPESCPLCINETPLYSPGTSHVS